MKFGLFFVLQRPEQVSERYIYETELPQMVAADQLGYDSVWIAEHHFTSRGVCSAPVVLAGAVAGQTKQLRVGMGITLLPLHDPIAIAEELAVLDLLSGGRLDVGIGRAATASEYSGYNVDHQESRQRVDEGLEILRGVWTQDPFSYTGTFRQVHQVSLIPKPLQQPHPPLYLAANSAETVLIAARHGLPMMASFLVLDQTLVERREVYRQVSAEHDHPPAEVEARLAQTWHIRFVYLADDERAARADPRDHLMDYITNPARANTTYDEYLDNGIAFYGTPAQVTEQIGRYQERTGVENLLCFTSVRAMDPAKVLRSMELFSTKVMPHFTQTPSRSTKAAT
jgi:luciferase family oxidoreductase group 1